MTFLKYFFTFSHR